jgi:hypothetical protein
MARLPTPARQEIGGNVLVWLQTRCGIAIRSRRPGAATGSQLWNALLSSSFFNEPSRLKLDELNWKVCAIWYGRKNLAGSLRRLWGDFVHSLRRADACDRHLLAWARALSWQRQSRESLRSHGRHEFEVQGEVTATRHRSRQQSSGRATDREL